MKYTKEIPTKPGWYSIKWVGSKYRAGIFDLFRLGVTDKFAFFWNSELEMADDRFEYAGPIEEPKE